MKEGTEVKSNWINIDIELPKFEGWYIIWDADNKNSKPAQFMAGGWEDVYTTVTHWQPLPKDEPKNKTISI